MNLKVFLIGCATVLVLAFLGLLIGGYIMYRRMGSLSPGAPGRLEMPAALKTSGVRIGKGFLKQDVFLSNPALGKVTDIVWGELDPKPGLELGIAGKDGAIFVDKKGNVRSSVGLGGNFDRVTIIDVEDDGVCEFINRGSWISKAALVNHQGAVVWRHGSLSAVDDMAAGDVDGDGIKEFAVGFNGGGGVHLVDRDGKKRWSKPDGNVWHVEMVDTDDDGRDEIVHSNAGGDITIRDSTGETVLSESPGPYFSSFSLVRFPANTSQQYLLLAEDNYTWLFDFDARTVRKLPAPDCGDLGDAFGTPVTLVKGKPHLAILVEYHNWDRSILYVYDPSGKLVYQEVIPEDCAAIAALALDNSGTEALLIGAPGKVLKYVAEPAGV
ncbi:MAG TPA: VCBS repeat-containing protein [Armatimonadota bacterium]|nr:VCBS repeat-containing protein [Armatimonadota bacterium]